MPVRDGWCRNCIVTEGSEASVVVENLYPTATFEVKVVALSNCKGYGEGDAGVVMGSGQR